MESVLERLVTVRIGSDGNPIKRLVQTPILTPAELEKYPDGMRKLVAWLNGHGFNILRVYKPSPDTQWHTHVELISSRETLITDAGNLYGDLRYAGADFDRISIFARYEPETDQAFIELDGATDHDIQRLTPA